MGRLGEVAPLDHHVAGPALPRICSAASVMAATLISSSTPMPVSAAASRRLGVATRAWGSSRVEVGRQPVGRPSGPARSRRPAPGRPPAGAAARRGQLGHDVDDGPVGQHAGLDAGTSKSSSTASICRRTKSRLEGHHAAHLAVFCAVTAVRAVVPWTPWAANVLRSAWAPAPPPESEPAMVRAVGRGGVVRHRPR